MIGGLARRTVLCRCHHCAERGAAAAVGSGAAAAPSPVPASTKPAWLSEPLKGFGAAGGGSRLDRRIPFSNAEDRVLPLKQRGTLDERIVGDGRYGACRFTPSLAVRDESQAAPDTASGQLEHLRMAHLTPQALLLHVHRDSGRSQRFMRAELRTWGSIVPHLARLTFARSSPAIRRGEFSAIAVTTAAIDETSLETPGRPDVSEEAVRRQFRLELSTYRAALSRSMDTTATPVLVGLLCSIHRHLGVPIPSSAESNKPGEERACHHRELMLRTTRWLVAQPLDGEENVDGLREAVALLDELSDLQSDEEFVAVAASLRALLPAAQPEKRSRPQNSMFANEQSPAALPLSG